MSQIRRVSLAAVVSASAFVFAIAAHAVPLNNGFVAEPFLDTALGGTTAAARLELAGIVLEDVLQPFSFNGVSGTVQNRVVRETLSGTLDFYWRIKVDPNNLTVSRGIEAFRLINFGYGDLNDADWRIDGLGSAAPFVGRLFNPATHPAGDINFLFTDPAVQPGDPNDGGAGSRFFFLHTGATDYAKTAQYDLLCAPSGCVSDLDATFAPAVTGVPEPSVQGLMLLGVALLAWARWRRNSF